MKRTTISRRIATVAAVAILSTSIGTLAMAGAGPAGADSTETVAAPRSAGEFYSLINSVRASHGLPGLVIDGALAGTAQNWANTMASSGTLAHDPNLVNEIGGWTKIGENVGMGPRVDAIWASFLNSPSHVANLLDPAYTHMGVGFVYSGGTVWTAHRFMRTAAVSAPASPPPTAPPATAPPATAPPATAPPAPDNPGDAVDCTNYSLWVEANGWYALYRPYYGDVAGLDPDGDGVPCEDLPGAPSWAQPSATAAPATGSAGGSGAGSGGGSGDGSGSGDDDDAVDPADPDRVAEVIDALRALPS